MSAADLIASLAIDFPNGTPRILDKRALQLYEAIKSLLVDHENGSIEVEEEEVIVPDMDCDVFDPDQDIYDDYSRTLEEDDCDDFKKIRFSGLHGEGELISPARVQAALEYYRAAQKGSRSLSSMHTMFPFVRNDMDRRTLIKFEREGLDAVFHRKTALMNLSKLLYKWTMEKLQTGHTLHNKELQKAAIEINEEKGTLAPQFKASISWIRKFKEVNRLCSRKITKFVSIKSLKKREETEKETKLFVDSVQDLIKRKRIPPSCVFNADQSALLKELHGNRSLVFRGEKTVERLVTSVSATTHSTTVMPMVFLDGSVHPILFVVLQLSSKQPIPAYYKTSNLYVTFNSSYIMTKDLMIEWYRELVEPFIDKKALMIADSWSSFTDHASLHEVTSRGKELEIRNIPAGATGIIQPLDVGYFAYFKNFVRKIVSHVTLYGTGHKIYSRDNHLKDFVLYAWFKGTFLPNRPPTFETPVTVCFPPFVSSKNVTKLTVRKVIFVFVPTVVVFCALTTLLCQTTSTSLRHLSQSSIN